MASALARYESAETYRLEFTQETYWALADSSTASKGVLWYRRPGLLSVSYEDGGRIVVTRDSVRVYAPAAEQFFAAAIDSSDVAIDPARILRAFTPDPASPFASSDPLSDGRRVVNLLPRFGQSEPARVEVTISPRDHTLSRVVAVATTGDRTTYWIGASSFGVPVSDSAFVLRRPPGVPLLSGSPF